MNTKGFTLIEIMLWILIFSMVIVWGFQALSAIWYGKIKLVQSTDIQKQSIYFSEKFFEDIKSWGTLDYEEYFNKYSKDEICLNKAPNYAVIKDFGIVTFGKNEKEANILDDIITHTMQAVLRASKLGSYKSISIKDSFEMEYWELEQAKLKK